LITARSFRYNRVEHAQHHPINSAKRLEHITWTHGAHENWKVEIIQGKPLIMDKMTTRMCNEGVGRLGFATILIVVNANKELKDRIEIRYKDKNNVTKGSKFVNVEYAWKPPMCAKYALKKW
nr:ATPase, F1/V1/A1 complex, alpha/beta subunit, zinc knuckle CX2CX4HX4C [Tanacetum cinerariifolium]